MYTLNINKLKIAFSYCRTIILRSETDTDIVYIPIYLPTYIWDPPRTLPRVERPFAVPSDRKNAELERFQNRKKK